VVALTPAPDAVALSELPARVGPDARLALVLGSEGPGLTPATEAAADLRVRIPLAATVDSLNVGVAAGIACYAVASIGGGP